MDTFPSEPYRSKIGILARWRGAVYRKRLQRWRESLNLCRKRTKRRKDHSAFNVQKDGSIGKTPYYTGLEENEAVYEFSSADKEKLEEDGAKRLKELQNYKAST